MKSAATTMCSYGTILVSFVVVIAFITTTTEGVYSQETPMPSTCDCGTKYCVAGPAPVFTLMKGSGSVGNGDFDATPQGPVGYGPGGSLTAAPIECLEVTPASFVVNPCGVVAPHNHANTAEVNTVISGEGVVCVLPEMEAASGAPDLQCYQAEAGDSFIFPKGLVHNWINVDKEYQFVTVTTFPDSDSPDAASMMTTPAGTTLQDSIAAGMLGSIVTQSGGSLEDGSMSADAMPMLDALVGSFGAATGIAAPLPLFPSFDDPASEGDSDSSSDNGSGSGGGFLSGSGRGAGDGSGPSGAGNVSEECKEAIDILSTLGDVSSDQIAAPKKYKLATTREMSRGVYNVGTDGIGGSIRLITKDAWPWLAEANMSLALYVFSYCGMLNIHVHSKANEWGTVIAGEGYVFQYGPNSPTNVTAVYVETGDTYYVPRGNFHWFVNPKPDVQFVTITSWSQADLSLSFLIDYLYDIPDVTSETLDLTLGTDYTIAKNKNQYWPLLTTAEPSGCGGDRECDTCGDTSFLDDFLVTTPSEDEESPGPDFDN